jgi:hypothetical protein
MQKVILLTEVGTLAKKLAGGSSHRAVDTHLEVALSDVASPDEAPEQDKAPTFGSFQFANSDRISTMIALLGDWNEPEFVNNDNQDSVRTWE